MTSFQDISQVHRIPAIAYVGKSISITPNRYHGDLHQTLEEDRTTAVFHILENM